MEKRNGMSSKYKKIFYIGARFGKWELIEDELIYSNPKKRGKLKVRCECGNESILDPYTLKKGVSQCCFQCGHGKRGKENINFKGYKDIPATWFYRYKNSKKNECEITIEEVYNLWIKQDKKCALSKLPIDFENSNRETKTGVRRYDLVCTASLDRIDSNIGYFIDNIQLVHKDINMIKKDYKQNYFLYLCALIAFNSPFETCTEELYNEMIKSLHSVDLTKVVEMVDNTNLMGEQACVGGACEIM